jgi:hypothetical protein
MRSTFTESNVAGGPAAWIWHEQGAAQIGSDAHRDLFCHMLLDTFDPYKPAVIPWPRLDPDALLRLKSLPFWDIAVRTESETAMRMQLAADVAKDRLVHEALALNAMEEHRHKEVLSNMIRFYGIEIEPEPDYPVPDDPEWAYMQTGYGECIDSFFAFGLFRLAQQSGFFPAALVEVFEPIIQEEARHILFFVNWAAWSQANRPAWGRPPFAARRFYALTKRIVDRLAFARRDDNNSSMTMKGHESIGIDLSPGAFLDLCLAENDGRMACYDDRLLRPQMVPRLVKTFKPLIAALA